MSKPAIITDYPKEIIKTITALSYRHSLWQVFADFVEMAALAISNSVDFIHKEQREIRYLEIIGKYNKEEQGAFPRLMAYLVEAMEEKLAREDGPADILGQVFHDLELHNKWKGQFFTPAPVCEMMASMTLGEGRVIKDKGFETVEEPAVGSGAMILGLAKAMKKRGFNYCNQMVVTATDVDLKCVHMAYVQFSLYGIPAVVIHGNTLSVEEWSRWYTPVYLLDGWLWRSQCTNTTARNTDDEALKKIAEPIYGALRELDISGETVDENAEIVTDVEEIVDEQPIFELKKDKNGQLRLF